MSTFCMLYAAMFDHVSLPAKLPFEKEEVGDLPKSSSSQQNENGERLVLSIRAIKQPPTESFLETNYMNISHKYIMLIIFSSERRPEM